MKKITILSGKGGTGKSSITASLAVMLSDEKRIILADCDVDASNLALLFGVQSNDYDEWVKLSTSEKAVFDHRKCISCGQCESVCYFDAIDMHDGKPFLKEFSCEGCGACLLTCPVQAIELEPVDNAKIGWTKTKYGFKVVSAQLEIGESGSGKVVAEVKKLAEKLSKNDEIMLIDSAAGIGCPVIASVAGSDLCIIVAEPTPSGIFDMQRAYDIVDNFNVKASIIINKFNLNPDLSEEIKEFADKKGLEILGKIPFDRIFIDSLVEMVPVVLGSGHIKGIFGNIIKKLAIK